MKNKENLKGMLTGAVLTAVVFGFTLPTMAQSTSRTAQVTYDNIQLIVNGQTVSTQDAVGGKLGPVLIDGTPYLPAQSLGEAFNMDVSWDSTAKTVTLTSKTGIAADQTGFIGLEKAKSIALEHAGVKSSDATFFKAQLDWDDGSVEYEIEFYSGNVEYDYHIQPTTGAILSWDHDVEGYQIPGQNSSDTTKNITLEQAKSLAMAKAPGATLISCKTDYEHGKLVYEGELRSGRTEYEFEIDAATGKFTKWSVDIDD